MSTPNTSFIQYSPYIRLTKDESGNYTLWLVTFIPQNYTIPNEPTVSATGSDIQVSVYVESGGATPSESWEVHSLKVALPTPSGSGASVNATVYLDDPEDEGSSKIPFDDAEEE
tara:strand:+ start:6384 stop:6725 length:342 start_codon:yes stop_codon:yes gene_type:complete